MVKIPLPQDVLLEYINAAKAINDVYREWEPAKVTVDSDPVLSELRNIALRTMGKEGAKKAVENIPLLNATFLFSALEAYVKDWTGEDRANKAVEEWSKRRGVDPDTAKKVHELRILRNVILHSGGQIDKKAEDEFKKYGIQGYRLADSVALDGEQVEKFIEAVKGLIA